MPRHEMMTFWRAWARHPGQVGAIAPSSTTLAKELVRNLRLNAGEAILEFGPGTGSFTELIQDLLPDPSAYLGIEREPQFVALLRRRFPRLRFVASSAEQAPDLAANAGLDKIRVVICGLPFASLSTVVQNAVIDALDRVLGPGGEFRTFQYVHAFLLPPAIRYRRRMCQVFGAHRRSHPVLRNLPPAYVLTWRR